MANSSNILFRMKLKKICFCLQAIWDFIHWFIIITAIKLRPIIQIRMSPLKLGLPAKLYLTFSRLFTLENTKTFMYRISLGLLILDQVYVDTYTIFDIHFD